MQTQLQLSTLLDDVVRVHPRFERPISGLSMDSRLVNPGDLFFALLGMRTDGRQYVNQAIQAGAAAVLCEGEPAPKAWASYDSNVPVFFVVNLASHLGNIVNRFYGNPSLTLSMIGVTGTNGKTSCTCFISQALTHLGQQCAVIGTLGSGVGSEFQPSFYTTPDAIQLQAQLAEFKQIGAKAVAMEVSSHGLDQGRVKGVAFDIGIFTNLSRDHLDYHGNLKNYGWAKQRLFADYPLRYAIINSDDEFGRYLIEHFKDQLTVYDYSLKAPRHSNANTVWARAIRTTLSGTQFDVMTPWGEAAITTQLLGHFNVSNLLAVMTTLLLLDIPFDEVCKAVTALTPIPGRMQTVIKDHHPLVVVDFAHTPDALAHALKTLSMYEPRQLWCVFGCGGDRDQGKRPQMASISEQYAHKVVVTSDNPRTEDPYAIIKDVMAGFAEPKAVQIEMDRSNAIAAAISQANKDDIILIAGKGHEQYQLIGQEQIPFCDVSIAKGFLS